MPLRPLEGFVVGVTADRRWQEQAELLRRRGAAVLHGPSITTLYLASDDTLRRVTVDLIDRPPRYVVATTGIGMRAWLEAAQVWGVGERLDQALASARVVARGPKAAAAVGAAGIEVWHRSATEQLDDVLAALLAQPLEGCRVAVQQYGVESPRLTAALEAAGAVVVEVPVYRWHLPDDPRPALRLVEAACTGRVDAVTFTSAPAVHNLFAIAAAQQAADDLRAALNGPVVAACVGPVCAEGARQEGVEEPLAPSVGRLGLLVRALGDHLRAHRCTLVARGAELVVQGSAVVVDGERVELSPRERALFHLLAARPGVFVSQATLLAKVWGPAAAEPHVLAVTIARLRRKLGRGGGAIETKAGRGYRINAEEAPPPRD